MIVDEGATRVNYYAWKSRANNPIIIICFSINLLVIQNFILIPFLGTQQIVSLLYQFGRRLIPSDFLKRIVTSNFSDMRNLMSVVFGLSKMLFWLPKKG